MRIYFVGSHATGKTTLCRYVSRRYGLPMISEVARAVLAEMETGLDALRTDMDLVAEYQERVFARQVAVEKLHDNRFVSDRAFDNLAYVAEHTTNAATMMNDQRFLDYMKWVRGGIVFFLRPHQSLLKDDGVRAGVSWDSVLRIDGMVKLMLEQHRISYLPIESVSMQERVRAVEFVLERCAVGTEAVAPVRAATAGSRPRTMGIESHAGGPGAAGAGGVELTAGRGGIAGGRSTELAADAAGPAVRASIESWPYAIVDGGDHEA